MEKTLAKRVLTKSSQEITLKMGTEANQSFQTICILREIANKLTQTPGRVVFKKVWQIEEIQKYGRKKNVVLTLSPQIPVYCSPSLIPNSSINGYNVLVLQSISYTQTAGHSIMKYFIRINFMVRSIIYFFR